MAITEVFPNPMVKKVIFQIRYPNLFFIESKMGDIQIRIMNIFPESKLLIRRHLLLTDVKSDFKGGSLPPSPEDSVAETASKIWHFSTGNGVELNILHDSLDITSSAHKTYNNPRPKTSEQ